MGWPYHFVDLSDEQKDRRRHLLDRYALIAQLSMAIPLLITQLLFLFKRIWDPASGRVKKERGSPLPANPPLKSNESWSVTWRKLAWWLDGPISRGWGTRRGWNIAGLWTAWLLVLAVKDTGDDYLHLTKRIGIIAASQLPIHYLLSAKTTWNPIQHLTRMSHEELNPYHRLLGRILLSLFTLHATLYLNFFIQASLLRKRIRDRDVLLGLLAISSFLLLGTTALSRIRHRNYRLFYTLHVLLAATTLPTLYFHVSHLRPYVLETSAIYLLNMLHRTLTRRPTPASLALHPRSNLLSLTLRPPRPLHPLPGQHIYISLPASALHANPFTIANLPAKDGSVHLVARALSGQTATLARLATSPRGNQAVTLAIEGPYGAATHFPDFATEFDRVLLVAGGVGATFAMPIFRTLRGPGRARFVWAVRGRADAAWGVEALRKEGRGGRVEGLEVFVTGKRGRRGRGVGGEGGEGMELLEQRGRLLGEGEDGGGGDVDGGEGKGRDGGGFEERRGRPDLRRIVDEVCADAAGGRVAVLVCGPAGMGEAVRREVGRWVGRGLDVWWHCEEFAW